MRLRIFQGVSQVREVPPLPPGWKRPGLGEAWETLLLSGVREKWAPRWAGSVIGADLLGRGWEALIPEVGAQHAAGTCQPLRKRLIKVSSDQDTEPRKQRFIVGFWEEGWGGSEPVRCPPPALGSVF